MTPTRITLPALFFVAIFGASQDLRADAPTRWIAVSGDCLKSVNPDRASVTMTAETLQPKGSDATRRSTETYEKLRAGLKKLNLKDTEFQTTEYSVQESVEWENNKRVSKGFKARIGLKILTSERERIGEVLNFASDIGVREIGNLETFMSREKRKAEEESCLTEAVRNARAKAETLAKASNAKVGKVLTIQESSAYVPPMPRAAMGGMAMMEAMPRAKAMPQAGIEAESEKLSISVNVLFALD